MKLSTVQLLAFLCVTLSAANVSAQLYKCRGVDGKILYSTASCPIGSKEIARLSSGTELRLANAYESETVNPGAVSATPPPSFDDVKQTPLGITQDQANRNARSDPGGDLVQWAMIGGILVVVWRVLKALGRGAKTVSKVAAQVVVDVAPVANQAASRVGATATARARDFFAETRKCPHCAELIKKEATVCRHCRRSVE